MVYTVSIRADRVATDKHVTRHVSARTYYRGTMEIKEMALIKTGTQTARLVTINYEDSSYDIIPGGKDSEFVEVPDELLDLPFVDALIEDGTLVAKRGQLSKVGESIDDLRAEAESLGVAVDKRWKVGRLKLEIESARQ